VHADHLAPTGVLRAAVNLGNPVLAGTGPDGRPVGVSVDLATALAAELGVALELVTVEKAARSVEAVRAGAADVGFFAVDPARSDGIAFTAPYVLIEGAYAVPSASPLQDKEDIDAAGVSVAVGSGSAYDLFLTREIRHATIERLAGAAAVRGAVARGEVDVAAGIRQVLESWAAAGDPLRVLPGRFMVIEQAMGLPAARGDDARRELAGFVERQKASGAVATALARHGVDGASVAPPA
jgi:polar amino acid transport system substrate-binding protein